MVCICRLEKWLMLIVSCKFVDDLRHLEQLLTHNLRNDTLLTISAQRREREY